MNAPVESSEPGKGTVVLDVFQWQHGCEDDEAYELIKLLHSNLNPLVTFSPDQGFCILFVGA